MKTADAVVRPASLQDALAVRAALALAVVGLGYTVALYGSSLEGRGRDVDAYLVPGRDGAEGAAAVAEALERRLPAFEVKIHEQDAATGRHGIVGVLHGIALDITVLP